jgi:hypothetical protein
MLVTGSHPPQITTFGAKPCFSAAMVSSDVQIAMFGGRVVPSSSLVAAI